MLPVLRLRRFRATVSKPLKSLCVGSCVGVLRRLRRLVVSHWKHCASVLRRSASVHPPYPPIAGARLLARRARYSDLVAAAMIRI